MENPRHWRLNKQRYLLIGTKCPDCLEKHFPPREVCPDCRKKENNSLVLKQPADVDKSAIATCSIYNGDPDSYLHREVKAYSEMIKSETNPETVGQKVENPTSVTTEIKIPSGVIYQNSGVAV